MSKILLLILGILSTNVVLANSYSESLDKIKETLKNNTKIYREKLEETQKSRLSEYYYKRVLAREVINQNIVEENAVLFHTNNQLITDVQSYEGNDPIEELYLLNLVKQNLKTYQGKLQEDLRNLKRISESFAKECDGETLDFIAEQTNPLTTYAVPTVVRNEMGAPIFNVTFEMNMNYTMEDGETSPGLAKPVDPNDDTKEIIVYGLGMVAQGVACAFGECTGTTFLVASAILSVVYDIVTGFKAQDDFEKFLKDVDSEYEKANQNLYNVHVELAQVNNSLIQERCSSIDLNGIKKHYSNSIDLLESLNNSSIINDKRLGELISIRQNKLKLDNALLEAMLKSKKQLFLTKVKNQISKLREEYAKKGSQVIRFFAVEIRPLHIKVKQSRGLDQLKYQRLLLEKIAEGDMSFGDYIVWTSSKRSLK